MDSLEEMDKFLEMQNLPRLNQEEIENMNRSTASKKIKLVILKTPNKQKCRTRQLHRWILPNTYPSQTIPKTWTERNAFKLILPGPHHPDNKTIQRYHNKREKYRPISLMNIDAKMLNRILVNQIQQYIKRIIHHDEVELTWGYKMAQYLQSN